LTTWWRLQRQPAFRATRALSALLAVGLWLALATPTVAQPDTPPLSGSVPIQIDIPSIGTHASVVPLGEEDDGTMQAPIDPDTVGWYSLGVGVGGLGNALLDGHVDWAGRLRTFGHLRQLEPGDLIKITDADGNVLSYGVSWIQLYDADTAPLAEIFDQTSNDDEVTLITCGGAFDPSVHMYVSRWVVRATRLNAD
jgi:sortase (surface protein transpeptidase)